MKIEDYAMIGDCHGAALIGKNGSLDWLCVPRFDSAACFSALLGNREHGRWSLAPRAQKYEVSRRYRPNTMTLETEFSTNEGTFRVVDCMPASSETVNVVRIVEGVSGRVPVSFDMTLRLGYGRIVPRVATSERQLNAIAGPDSLRLTSEIPLDSTNSHTGAEFEVSAGQALPFVLTHFPSHAEPPPDIDPFAACERSDRFWRAWAKQSTLPEPHAEAVARSLLTLKALTYAPTGGLVAAATTSLPEKLGGSRNWDYRYCWLRDATSTLLVLLEAGHDSAAEQWREWLLRAAGGSPSQLQVLYGVAGERTLHEFEQPWLPGYESSTPVRVGNKATDQLQLDIYGEVMDMMHECRQHDLENPTSWELERAFLEHLESCWNEPDHGIWEVRSQPRHFTHSKVMCWVAFDRAVRAIEDFHREGPLERYKALRARIHREICERAYNERLQAFTQHYESDELDASVLIMAKVGFLPPSDARIVRTVEAIQKHLTYKGLVLRYRPRPELDGLDGSEGCFLPCSFWLVDNLVLMGRTEAARSLFERLLGLCNDVGLLSEEYDLDEERQLGNFPQALTHLALVNSAQLLSKPGHGKAFRRAHGFHGN